jgi:hypothetical protein
MRTSPELGRGKKKEGIVKWANSIPVNTLVRENTSGKQRWE